MIFGYIQFFTWIISNTIGRVFMHLKVYGLENIESVKPGGYIFASNHEGAIDPFLIGAALPRAYYKKAKALRFLTYYKHITMHWYGFFIWLTGAFPVYPGKKDLAETTATTVKLLHGNQDVLIFPTARRNGDFFPNEARPGVAYIAEQAKGLITPVFITGTHNVTLKDLIFKRRRVVVAFGKQLNIVKLKKDGDTSRDVARKVMESVKELQEKLGR